MKTPFEIIASHGKGVAYSSFTRIGSLFPSQTIGQARLALFANIGSGNLVLQDYPLQVEERNFPLALHWVYNHQAREWVFGEDVRLTDQESGKSVSMRLGDGSVVAFLYDQGSGQYLGQPDADGRMVLTQSGGNWIAVHTATQMKNVFNSAGLRTQSMDAVGRTTTYAYQNKVLSSISAPSGEVYTLARSGLIVNLTVRSGEVLHSWTFDDQAQLVSSARPQASYTIQYAYVGGRLATVTQTDGTSLQLAFTGDNIESILLSNPQSQAQYRYDIQYPEQANQAITLTDSEHNTRQFFLDNNKQMQQLIWQDDTTHYVIENGQLTQITHPDGAVRTHQYDSGSGLRTQTTLEDGRIETWHYAANDNLLSKTQAVSQTKNVTHRFVYDDNWDKSSHRFLRFTISPSGRVMEFRPDAEGNIQSQRHYLSASYTAATSRLAELLAWVGQQDASAVNLIEYQYNPHGQVVTETRYATVDSQGKGVVDANTGIRQFTWNLYGQKLTETQTQTSTKKPITRSTFDALLRPLTRVDALNQTTTHQYLDASQRMNVQYPSGRTVEQQYSALGVVLQQTQTAEQQTRTSSVVCDDAGREVKQYLADGRLILSFFDAHNRVHYTVSTTGFVTEYVYNEQRNFHQRIEYNQPVDPAKLYVFPNPSKTTLPDVRLLVKQLQPDPTADRATYQFFDVRDRLQFEVAADGSVVEHRYDGLSRETAHIAYHQRLTAEQIQALTQGKAPTLAVDFTQDRCVQTFYNDDNDVIGQIDEAGYVLENSYDPGGRKTSETHFATSVQAQRSLDVSWPGIKPAPSDNDASHYFYYDHRDQMILEVDATRAVQAHSYTQNGLRYHTVMYSNRAPANWDPANAPVMTSSNQDHGVVKEFDLLNRLSNAVTVEGRSDSLSYDVMGHVVEKKIEDLHQPNSQSADDQRRTQARFDAWAQKTASANEMVSQLMLEKPADQEKIWQDQSQRFVYDQTGLLLNSTDPLGNRSVYYYDDERRLVVTINGRGAVVEKGLNRFGEVITERAYATLIALTGLTGGVISTAFRQTLNQLQTPQDRVTHSTRNQVGEVTQHTDAAGFITTMTYNAFSQVLTRTQALADAQQTRTVTSSYDPRGLLQQKQTVGGSITRVERWEFASFHHQPTAHIAADGASTHSTYDGVGQLLTVVDALNITVKTLTYNPFGQVSTRKDALGALTQISYDITKRTVTEQTPIQGELTVSTLNVFAQIRQKTDAYQNTQTWQFAPNGKVSQHRNGVGDTTTTQYNLLGLDRQHTDAMGTLSIWTYDAALNTQTEVIDGTRTTTYQYTAHNQVAQKTNANSAISTYDYDPRGVLTLTTVDPTTLSLLTTNTLRADARPAQIDRGDRAAPNALSTRLLYDDIGRKIGTEIDPANLKITQTDTLDAVGRVIAKTNADGYVSRLFYDGLGQKRFVVTECGGVTEWQYNDAQLLTSTRQYETGVDVSTLSNATTLAQMVTLMQGKTSPQDTVTWSFYDANHRLRFTVSALGAVQELRYDLAGRQVVSVQYATLVDVKTLSTTAALAQTMQANASVDDRYHYQVYDAANRVRFAIDADQFISETVYNANGKAIKRVRYATAVPHPAQLVTQSLDDISASIVRSLTEDRYTYTVYTAFNEPWFTLDELGGVVRFDHDGLGNQTATVHFAARLSLIPATYAELVQQLKQLQPNAQTDRITKKTYDAANRVTQTTDAMGHIDQFALDSLGNHLRHTDRGGFVWTYGYNAANRLEQKATPQATITVVSRAHDGHLTQTTETASVVTEIHYTPAGLKFSETFAKDTNQARVIQYAYSPCLDLTTLTFPSVSVDDATVVAGFATLPIKSVSVVIHKVYNAKRLCVAEQQASGSWLFHVHDAMRREVYSVAADGSVIGRTFDAFGQVSVQTAYATKLTLDLSQYTQTGIALSVLQGALKTSADDQTTLQRYNRRGLLEQTTEPSTFYYVSYDQDDFTFDQASPEKRTAYNAFGESVAVQQLIDAKKQTWRSQYTWRDQKGRIRVQAQAVEAGQYYCTEQDYDAFSERTRYVEVATKVALEGDPRQLSLASMVATLAQTTSNQDRRWRYAYDLLGQLTSETKLQVVRQQLTITDGEPTFADAPAQDLTLRYGYDARQNRVQETLEDGSARFQYFDARNKKMVFTEVTRASDVNETTTLTPLTYCGYDYYGHEVSMQQFAQGCRNPEAGIIPLPIDASDPNNLLRLMLVDNRGLVQVKQDPEGILTGFTYTANKKVARTWRLLTNVTYNNRYQNVVHVDERRMGYDRLSRVNQLQFVRDNAIVQTTAMQYDSFGNIIGEGPGDGTYPLYRRYTSGNTVWNDNAHGGRNLINLSDLTGHTTASIVSSTQDLSSKTPAELAVVVATDNYLTYEKTEMVRDLLGQQLVTFKPWLNAPHPNQRETIPLSFTVAPGDGTHFSAEDTWINWGVPQEVSVTPTFTLYPRNSDHGQGGTVMAITTAAGRNGVNVSDAQYGLHTDVYDYEILYTLKYPFGDDPSKDIVRYQTRGQIQFDLGDATQSNWLVAIIAGSDFVQLSGKTTNLTAVQLWPQGATSSLASIAVDPATSLSVDLSTYPSGEYTFVPEYNQVADSAQRSLPFKITTAVPAAGLHDLTLAFGVDFVIKSPYGQLNWQISDDFADASLKISCEFQTTFGARRTHTDTLQPGLFKTSNGFSYNTLFPSQVNNVFNLSVEVEGPGGVSIPIFSKVAPASSHKVSFNITQYDFNSVSLAYITGMPGLTQAPTIQILDMRYDRVANWIALDTTGITADGFVVNMAGLPTGVYPYKVNDLEPLVSQRITLSHDKPIYVSDLYFDQSNQAMQHLQYVRLQQAAAKRCVRLFQAKTHQALRRKVSYQHDRWGNILQRSVSATSQAASLVTTYAYNDLNKRVREVQPEVLVWAEDGSSTFSSPVEITGYDALGNRIGVRDANQNTRGFVVNAAGEIMQDVLADGTVVSSNTFDALSRLAGYSDSRGKSWSLGYDGRGKVISSTSPENRVTRHTFNEAGKMASQTDATGRTIHYNYSVNGFIIDRFDGGNNRFQMQYDRNGRMLSIAYPGTTYAGTLTWTRDYFGAYITGQPAHVDFSGAQYTYVYDFQRRVTAETSTGGQHGKYYDLSDVKLVQVNGVAERAYRPRAIATPNQDIEFVYQGDRLIGAVDRAHHKTSSYGYDAYDRLTHVQVTAADNVVLQDVDTYYDALNRPIWLNDGDMVMSRGYDAVGNRRFIQGRVYSRFSDAQPIDAALYNTFNRANYVLVSNGVLDEGVIKIAENQGVLYTYEQGFRASQQYMDNQGTHTVVLSYHDDGQIYRIKPATTTYPYLQYLFNADGRLHIASKTFVSGSDSTGNGITNSYDAVGQLLSSQFKKSYGVPKHEFYTTTFDYKPSGVISGRHYSPVVGHTQLPTTSLSYTYAGFDHWALIHMTAVRRGTYYATQLNDANGNLSAQLNEMDDKNGYLSPNTPSSVSYFYETTFDGMILKKLRLNGNHFKDNYYTYGTSLRYFYDARKNYLGSYEIDAPSKSATKATPSMLYERLIDTPSGSRSIGFNETMNGWSFEVRGGHERRHRRFTLVDYVQPLGIKWMTPGGTVLGDDFDVKNDKNVRPLIGRGLSMVSSSYVVQSGDTYSSVANQLLGDSSLGDSIAAYNGRSVQDDPLVPGQVLLMPSHVNSTNRWDNNMAYGRFLDLMIDNLAPYMPQLQLKKHKRNILQVIAVALAGVAAMLIAPGLGFEIAIAMGLGESSVAVGVLTSIIGAGVAGLSDAAEQGILVGIGVVDHFEMSYELQALLSGAGVGTGGATAASKTLAQLMITRGIASATMQLLEMSVGLRQHFDVGELLTSMAMVVVDTSLQSELAGIEHFADYKLASLSVHALETSMSQLAVSAIHGEPIDATGLFNSVVSGLVADAVTPVDWDAHMAQLERYKAAQQGVVPGARMGGSGPGQRSGPGGGRSATRGHTDAAGRAGYGVLSEYAVAPGQEEQDLDELFGLAGVPSTRRRRTSGGTKSGVAPGVAPMPEPGMKSKGAGYGVLAARLSAPAGPSRTVVSGDEAVVERRQVLNGGSVGNDHVLPASTDDHGMMYRFFEGLYLAAEGQQSLKGKWHNAKPVLEGSVVGAAIAGKDLLEYFGEKGGYGVGKDIITSFGNNASHAADQASAYLYQLSGGKLGSYRAYIRLESEAQGLGQSIYDLGAAAQINLYEASRDHLGQATLALGLHALLRTTFAQASRNLAENAARGEMRSRVFANIAKSKAARESSGFKGLSAKINQMSGGAKQYTGKSSRFTFFKPADQTARTYAGRDYNPSKAGGPLRNLVGTQDKIQITHRGIDVVESHISRFVHDEANAVMIKRLREIADGQRIATAVDRNFYTHELREYVRYRKLGWKEGLPGSEAAEKELWNNTHSATLEEYQLSTHESELYTSEALQKGLEQLEAEFLISRSFTRH